jgi:hypothetical protein
MIIRGGRLFLIEVRYGLRGVNGSLQISCLSRLSNLPQDWPTGDMEIKPESLQCSLCGTKICLVAQVGLIYLVKCVLMLGYVPRSSVRFRTCNPLAYCC